MSTNRNHSDDNVHRIRVGFPREQAWTIRSIAAHLGISASEVVRQAWTVYQTVRVAKAAGHQVVILENTPDGRRAYEHPVLAAVR